VDPNPFTAVDRDLLKRCLNRSPGSWNDFVDRFLSLIYHVIGYTAHLRSVRLRPEDVEDIAAEVLLKIVAHDFRVLREFRGESSLATYLTVVARRLCIQELVRRQKLRDASRAGDDRAILGEPDDAPAAVAGLESLDEVEKLLRKLSGKEREIVRMYYLEGRTYEEISTETDVPVNTIGSLLSRARKKLRSTVKQTGGMDSLAVAATGLSPPPPPAAKPGTPGKLVAPPADGAIGAARPAKPAKPAKPTRPAREPKEGE
jgi:RNA polymerase sigma-70 factor (ECF subfamily)